MEIDEFLSGLLEKCKNPADDVYTILSPLSTLEWQFIQELENNRFQNKPLAKWFFLNKKYILDNIIVWQDNEFDDIPDKELNGEKDNIEYIYQTITWILDAIERYSYLENYTL